MPEKHRKQWEALGTSDPYWAVLSDLDKRDFGWDSAEFFETGIEEISNVYKKLDLMGVRLNFELALDYGCGVGRLSRALATSFQRVLGIDFSESMLLEARSVNTDIENINFLCNNG
jgi:2-polyprenyl-3-methyl-5-hydroxy-6-metoxy-1,4-benzoquinol methylase